MRFHKLPATASIFVARRLTLLLSACGLAGVLTGCAGSAGTKRVDWHQGSGLVEEINSKARVNPSRIRVKSGATFDADELEIASDSVFFLTSHVVVDAAWLSRQSRADSAAPDFLASSLGPPLYLDGDKASILLDKTELTLPLSDVSQIMFGESKKSQGFLIGAVAVGAAAGLFQAVSFDEEAYERCEKEPKGRLFSPRCSSRGTSIGYAFAAWALWGGGLGALIGRRKSWTDVYRFD